MKAAPTMYPSAILQEAQQLHSMSDRLDLLSDEHPQLAEALLIISASVRDIATSLELLELTKALPSSEVDSATE
jgi:hypothetical protein